VLDRAVSYLSHTGALAFEVPASEGESISGVALRLREGVYDERTEHRFVELPLWLLTRPLRDHVDTSGSPVQLDYVGATVGEVGDALRVDMVLEGQEVGGSPPLTVVARRDPCFGVARLGLTGESDSLWQLLYLSRMLTGQSRMSPGMLRDDDRRWGWIRAALNFSYVITPWIWRPPVDHEFAMARPVPDAVSIIVEPQLFTSRAAFFSQIGERLVGEAGYAGRDLQGFSEIVREVAHVVPHFKVSVRDRDACVRAERDNFGGSCGFVESVLEILSESVDVQTIPDH